MPSPVHVTQMPDLTRVAVVRPKLTGKVWATKLAIAVGLSFLNAYIFMLAVAFVTPWHPSYWQSLVALIGLRIAQVSSGWINWTHPAVKS